MFPENVPALQQVQFGQVAAYGVAYETALLRQSAASQFELGGPPYFKILTGIGVQRTAWAGGHLTSALHEMMTGWQLRGDL